MSESRSIAGREIGWALGWMARPPGLLVLALYAAMVTGEIGAMLYAARLRGLDRQLMLNVVFTLQISSLMMAVGTWMFFLSRRTFVPFRPDRLGDLLASPLNPRELWPGVLVGPAVIAVGFAVIAQTLNLAIPALAGEPHYLAYSYLRSPSTMSPEQLFYIRIVAWARVPLMVLMSAVLPMAYGALAAVVLLPKSGTGRLVVVLLLAQLLLVPEIVMALWVDNSAVVSNAVGERFQLISDHFSGPMLTLGLGGGLYAACLRVLRGQRFQARLVRAMERL